MKMIYLFMWEVVKSSSVRLELVAGFDHGQRAIQEDSDRMKFGTSGLQVGTKDETWLFFFKRGGAKNVVF